MGASFHRIGASYAPVPPMIGQEKVSEELVKEINEWLIDPYFDLCFIDENHDRISDTAHIYYNRPEYKYIEDDEDAMILTTIFFELFVFDMTTSTIYDELCEKYREFVKLYVGIEGMRFKKPSYIWLPVVTDEDHLIMWHNINK
jgi:hypothetical protein